MIPAGEKIILIEGTHVRITQSLGGNFTILVNGNLVKVARAIKKPAKKRYFLLVVTHH